MQGVLRTFICQNRRCAAEFDDWNANPACPRCGNVRVQWKPGGGHVGKRSGGIDAEFRTLADNYGLSDLHSARAGEAAKIPHRPSYNGPEVVMEKRYGQGFSAPVLRSADHPHGIATCTPSTTPVNLKGKVRVGRALPRSGQVMSTVQANTAIEARHTGQKP
jgi:hypothetical protein